VINAICQSKLDAATTDAMRNVIKIYAISVIREKLKITWKSSVERSIALHSMIIVQKQE